MSYGDKLRWREMVEQVCSMVGGGLKVVSVKVRESLPRRYDIRRWSETSPYLRSEVMSKAQAQACSVSSRPLQMKRVAGVETVFVGHPTVRQTPNHTRLLSSFGGEV